MNDEQNKIRKKLKKKRNKVSFPTKRMNIKPQRMPEKKEKKKND